MYFTGFADEASADFDGQIKATRELGWKYIETRALCGGNLASITDGQFDEVCAKLEKAGVSFNSFGSGIGNWAKPITEPPDSSYEEMRKAIPRMQRLGIKFIRIMSFLVAKELREKDFRDEAVKRIKVIAEMAEDAGIICVHENCNSWGGLSFEHTLRLVEGVNSPALKLVFDTGNPVVEDDVRGKPPYRKQSSWEFYNAVREHVVYVHIKDGRIVDGKNVFTFPGEGDGDVRKIVKDLLKGGYDGGFSMEPHMVTVFHDKSVSEDDKQAAMYSNYVEYGRRFLKLLAEVKKELGK
ncbi:MAG: sugar phosphate isomerase/epimerase family protein [Victivallales bacterium]